MCGMGVNVLGVDAPPHERYSQGDYREGNVLPHQLHGCMHDMLLSSTLEQANAAC